MDTSSLIPYARNSRTHSDAQIAQIAASIKEFGFANPVLVRGASVVAGHGRLLAAQKLGLATVPTIDLSYLTETQARAYVIADNQLALNAGWDTGMLTLELVDLQAQGFDLDLLGLPDASALLAAAEAGLPEGVDEDADVEVPEDPITQPGDLILLGKHRLLCGSATVMTDVERLVDGELLDMMWTDPPCNVSYKGKTKDALEIQNDSMGNEDFRQFLLDAYLSAFAVLKPGGAVYVAHADSEGENFRGAMRESGLLVKQCLVWVKSGLVMGRQDYQWKHEPILYGWKEGAAHTWISDRKQTTVLEFNKPSRNGEHPTMKPVELVEYCLRNHIQAGPSVLDLFGGSGTTMIAAEKIGARAYLMELDPRYCDVIVKRWELLTGKMAVRPGGFE